VGLTLYDFLKICGHLLFPKTAGNLLSNLEYNQAGDFLIGYFFAFKKFIVKMFCVSSIKANLPPVFGRTLRVTGYGAGGNAGLAKPGFLKGALCRECVVTENSVLLLQGFLIRMM